MKNISLSDVSHIAVLANLNLSADESEKLSKMLSDTLDYVKVLEELNTSSVPETFQVTGLVNVYRETNFPNTSITRKEALSNAPLQKEGKFGTKAVFEKE